MSNTEPHELTVAQVAAAIGARELSSVELLQALLDRSDALEPRLGLWATLDAEYAMRQARERDRALASGDAPASCTACLWASRTSTTRPGY